MVHNKKKKEEAKEKKQAPKQQKNAPRSGEVNANIPGPSKENRGGSSRSRGGFNAGGGSGGRGQTNRRGGRGAPAPREGKRVYDRKSGTGRGRELRKSGYGGAGAVGKWEEEAVVAQETIQAEQTANKDAAAGETKVEEVPVEDSEEQKALKKEEEEEKKKKSFDQWLAEKNKNKVVADSQLNTREVEVDEKQFKASKVFSKEDDVAEYSALKKESKLKKGKGKTKKNVVSLDEFNSKAAEKQPEGEAPAAAAPAQSQAQSQAQPRESNRENNNRDNNRDNRDNRDNRGGRGRARGGDRGRGGFRGRGRGRGGRGNGGREANLALSDDNAFPKLS